jgi:hypothetical protein
MPAQAEKMNTDIEMILWTIGTITLLYTVGLWGMKRWLNSERDLIDKVLRESNGELQKK